MNITTQFQAAIDGAHAAALRQVLTPAATAAELRELVDHHPQLGALTLDELLGDASKPTARRESGKAPKRQTSKKGFNVRTAAGRAALEAAVLDALDELGKKDVSATDIREKLGATAAQIRTVLNRAIESGAVTYTGKARATRYSLA